VHASHVQCILPIARVLFTGNGSPDKRDNTGVNTTVNTGDNTKLNPLERLSSGPVSGLVQKRTSRERENGLTLTLTLKTILARCDSGLDPPVSDTVSLETHIFQPLPSVHHTEPSDKVMSNLSFVSGVSEIKSVVFPGISLTLQESL